MSLRWDWGVGSMKGWLWILVVELYIFYAQCFTASLPMMIIFVDLYDSISSGGFNPIFKKVKAFSGSVSD